MSEIVLIKPPPPGKYKELGKAFQEISSVPSLGLLYIAQFLIQHGFNVNVLDLTVNTISKNTFIKILSDEQPKILGISVLTEFYYSAIELAKTIKEWNPDTIVVFGGQHVTFIDDEALKTGVVDIVVRHEGEITMLELAEHLIRKNGKKLSEIEGITYLIKDINGFKIKRNPTRPPIRDLDALPFPARNLIDLNSYRYGGAMISSRGCPGGCVFCSAGAMSGRLYRTRTAKNVVAEMLYIYNILDYNVVSIVDDTMTATPKRLNEICQLLINSKFEGTWTCESRVDVISKEILQKMADAGCKFIQFGLESGDQYILDTIRKGITLEQIENAIKWARDVEMEVKCSYMIGHHMDTHGSIQKTVDFVERLNKEYGIAAPVSITTPFPGTYLYNHADELGVKILSRDWSEYTLDRAIIETKYLSADDLQRWHYVAAEKWIKSQQSNKRPIPK